jgi:glycosyltransferase involved in cell wall biosynthesis
MRVLIATVVHHPQDTRILHRQARALHQAGHDVMLAAPFSAFAATPPPWLTPLDLPRASGRHRRRALLVARDVIWRLRDDTDLVLLHDPELLLAVAGREDRLPPLVWDVHEDTASSLTLKPWLPALARPLARAAVLAAERRAEHRIHLLLAERSYAGRFTRPHPVIPNRVVYIGAISRARGATELFESARHLKREGIRTELIGTPDEQTRPLLDDAVSAGAVLWSGFLPNDQAMARIDGALAGLCLLRDELNYQHSIPTKIIEYMSRGVPTVTTPLPLASAVIRQHGCGIVVPFDKPASVVRAVLALRDDPQWRAELGRSGHRAARNDHHWPNHASVFVDQLERWARHRSPRTPSRFMQGS